MSRALVGRGRSTRSATGAGGSGPWAGVAAPFWRADGRGIDGPPPVGASLHGLRPQTALRRTIDPSPSYARGRFPTFLRSLLLAQRVALRPSRRLLPWRTIVSLLHDGSMEPNITRLDRAGHAPPRAEGGLLRVGGNEHPPRPERWHPACHVVP